MCALVMLAALGAPGAQASAQTPEELSARCVNLGKRFSYDEQVLACTRQLTLPGRTPEQQAVV
ncbi:MAG: hypothetical protein IPL62_11070 [Caulobacteraceae bacterium]|nr:hypothetical protein [Caulobacteraceae bacterium]